jgi:Protein of unknown function (DUF2946)
MCWFRDNIGRGSWLALLALVMNLGLSFGHIHAIEAKCGEPSLISLAMAVTSHHGQRQGHPTDSHGDYLCPICTAAAAMASPLASAPPMLPVRFDIIIVDRPIEAVLAIDQQPTAAFQSRGPPTT